MKTSELWAKFWHNKTSQAKDTILEQSHWYKTVNATIDSKPIDRISQGRPPKCGENAGHRLRKKHYEEIRKTVYLYGKLRKKKTVINTIVCVCYLKAITELPEICSKLIKNLTRWLIRPRLNLKTGNSQIVDICHLGKPLLASRTWPYNFYWLFS